MNDTNPNLNEDGTPKVDPNPSETGGENTPKNNDGTTADGDIDYKTKFAASTTENQRIMAEKKAIEDEKARVEAELAALKSEKGGTSYGNEAEVIPGFDLLGEEEQKNLLAYTKSIEDRTLNRIKQDPAYAFARKTLNENKWEQAYGEVAKEFPDLSKDEFKSKYFKADVDVPNNIGDLLKDLAKIELYDKAKDLGAIQALQQNDRIEIERAKGGDKTPTSSRTIEDWQRLATENPAKFAQLSKQFDADMASGKLK